MKLAQRAFRWRTDIQIVLWKHGWAWPVAMCLLVAAAALHVLVLEPVRLAVSTTQRETARESQATPRQIPAAPAANAQQQLLALQYVVRRSPDANELVRKMAALAQASHVVLAQGEYQQQVHGTTQLMQVHITQPVRASYSQLRGYVESVLRDIPNASLDQLSARRENVGQAQLEARLRWSFWTQATPDGESAKAAAGSEPVASSAMAAVSQTLQPVVPRDHLIAIAPRVAGEKPRPARDLFSQRNWNPPAPPAAAPAPTPMAPPLPFVYFGKKLQDGAWEVYLGRGEQTYVVRKGQVLDETWRVDNIAPPSISMTYLPLAQSQTLPIGDSL